MLKILIVEDDSQLATTLKYLVEDNPRYRVVGIADEDLARSTDEKTSAVHFLRFEFSAAQRAAIRAGAAVKIGCDHTHYPAHGAIAAETLARLAGDLAAA